MKYAFAFVADDRCLRRESNLPDLSSQDPAPLTETIQLILHSPGAR